MARKPQVPQQSRELPKLLISRADARDRLLTQLRAAAPLTQKSIGTEQGLEESRSELRRWTSFTEELARRIFTTTKYADEFVSAGRPSLFIGGRPLHSKIDDFRSEVKRKIEHLESLAERLDLIEETSSAALPTSIPKATRPTTDSRDVFLVHGRDEDSKAIVARFLEHCDLVPIILHEQPSRSQTIMEKFEQNSDVPFAVVLLTPDDHGSSKSDSGEGEGAAMSRPRQNVILELGYFIGKLGRQNVCALKKGDMELPSDFLGVVYTPFGPDEGWKLSLARELKAAGFEIDLNKALA